MRIRLKIIDLLVIALFISVFKIAVIPDTVRKILKLGLTIGALLYLVTHLDIRKLCNMALALAISIIVSGVRGYLLNYISFSSLLDGILYGVCIYALYLLVLFAQKENRMDRLVKDLFILSSIYCIGSLITMVIYGRTDGTDLIDQYFCGNKFFTSYMFMQCTALYWIAYQEKINGQAVYRIGYLVLCMISVLAADWLYCSTAVIGGLVLLCVPAIPSKAKRMMTHPTVAILVIICFAAILLVLDKILNLAVFRILIQDILGESLHLTGRTAIYKNLSEIIYGSIWLGYGYNNTAIREVVGYGNAQNGLLELMVGFGLVGTMFFLALVWNCFRQGRKKGISWGHYAMLYALMVCSIVEVSYNYYFFLILFLTAGSGNAPKRKNS